MREGILGLRTSLGDDRGFVDTLQTYLEQWQGQSGVAVELVTEPDPFPPRLTPNGEVQLLRIIQEALANVRKHAGASHAQVLLVLDGPYLEASIVDDGAASTRRRSAGHRCRASDCRRCGSGPRPWAGR